MCKSCVCNTPSGDATNRYIELNVLLLESHSYRRASWLLDRDISPPPMKVKIINLKKSRLKGTAVRVLKLFVAKQEDSSVARTLL